MTQQYEFSIPGHEKRWRAFQWVSSGTWHVHCAGQIFIEDTEEAARQRLGSEFKKSCGSMQCNQWDGWYVHKWGCWDKWLAVCAGVSYWEPTEAAARERLETEFAAVKESMARTLRDPRKSDTMEIV